MVVATQRDHRRGAVVLHTIRVGVDALMQLRRSTERQRPEESYGNERRDDGTSVVI